MALDSNHVLRLATCYIRGRGCFDWDEGKMISFIDV